MTGGGFGSFLSFVVGNMAFNESALLLRSNQQEHVELSNNVSLRNLSTFTFEAWVKVGSASTNAEQRAFMIRQGGNQKRVRFACTPIRGKLRFELARVDGRNDTNYTYPVTWDDRWHHVAFVAHGDESRYYMYLDGSLVLDGYLDGFGLDAEDQPEKISDTPATAAYIGASSTDGKNFRYWDGKIDNIRIWSGVRSEDQLQAGMYTFIEYPDNESNLLGEWRLENTGTSSITATRPSGMEDGVWTGTLRRGPSRTPTTNLWTSDRPFMGEFERDTTPPTTPPSITTSNITSTSFRLAWGASTDNVYVQFYEVTVATTSSFSQPIAQWSARNVGLTTAVTIDGLDPATNYYARVRAFDANGNASDFRTLTSPVTTDVTGDIIPPDAPVLRAATDVGATMFRLTWDRTDPSATGYKLDIAFDPNFENFVTSYRNRDVGNVWTVLVDQNIPPTTTLYCRVRAYDAAENESTSSNVVRVVTLNLPDTQPPSAVVPVEAAGVESRRFVARWLPSSDNVGVTGYRIDVSQTADFSYYVEDWEDRDVGDVLQVVVEPVAPQSTYYYRVRAYDAAGNISPNSEHVVSVTTLSVSLMEEGLRMETVMPSDSVSVRLDNGNIETGNVSVELRGARPVGRVIEAPAVETHARYMFSDREGPLARNSGRDTHTPVNIPHAEYVGPVELRVDGPDKVGFGEDAYGVRFLEEFDEHGYVVLPPSLPNLTNEDGTANDIYFWFKVDDLSGGGTFLDFARDESGQDSFRLGYTESGQVTGEMYNGTSRTHSFTSTARFTEGTWNSLLYSRSKSGSSYSVNLFLNGTGVSVPVGNTALPHKYRPLRWVGRGTDGSRLKGAMFGLMFGSAASTSYAEYAAMENTVPTSAYIAVYRFPLEDVTGRIESVNVNFPVFEGSSHDVEIYHLTGDDWGEDHFSREILNTRGTPIQLSTSPESEGIEVDITSIVDSDTDKDITLAVAQKVGSTVDGLILGRHDDDLLYQPTMSLEVDYAAALEPRTLTLTPQTVEVVNLFSNPSFEGGTLGVGIFGGADASVTGLDAFVGQNSLRIDPTDSPSGTTQGIRITSDSDLNLEGQHVIQPSFYIKGEVEDEWETYLAINYTDGSDNGTGRHSFPVTTKWTRHELPERLSDPTKTIKSVTLYVFKEGPSTNPVWVDAVMAADVTPLHNRVRIPYFDATFNYVEAKGVVHASPSYLRTTEVRVRSTYVGDNNENSTAHLQYRPTEAAEWVSVPDALTIDRTTREVTGAVPIATSPVNHVINPSGERGRIDGWNTGSNVNFMAVTEDAFDGIYSFRLANGTGGVGQSLTNVPAVKAGETWIVSLWARGQNGGEQLIIQNHGLGSNGSTSATEKAEEMFTLSTNWERFSVPLTIQSANYNRVRFEAVNNEDVIFLDAIQQECSEHLTPYVDGDSVGGWWEGIPHASRSGRFMTPRTVFDIRVAYDDPDGVVAIYDIADSFETPVPADNILTVEGMELDAQPREIRVIIRYKGDDNETARLLLQWKRKDRTAWSSTAYSWDRKNKRITAVISGLDAGAEYEVAATFADDNSAIYGENPILRGIVTPVEGVGDLVDARISFGGFVLLGPNVTNISVTEHDAFNAPEREINYSKLARVHGEVEQGDVWRRKVINMSGYISANSRQELADTLAAFKHAMTGRQQRLVIDTLDSRSFYNLATVTDLRIPQTGGENYRHLRWEAEFTCADPFRYDTKETVEEEVPLAHGEIVVATNEGDVECEAFYTITTQHVVTPVEVTLINRTTGMRITPTVTIVRGDKLEIDTARLRVMKNGVDVDFLGGFPRLERGGNELSLQFSPSYSVSEGISQGRLTIRRRHRYF